MSKQAKLDAKKFKKTPDCTRVIICEEVYDYRIGNSFIVVVHPASKKSFEFAIGDLNIYDQMALKSAIYRQAKKLIPSLGQSVPTNQINQSQNDQAEQVQLFS